MMNHVSINQKFIKNTYKLEFYAVTKQLLLFKKNHPLIMNLKIYENQQIQAQMIRSNSLPVINPPGYTPYQQPQMGNYMTNPG